MDNGDQEKQVLKTVESFYAAFNSHDFESAAEYATDDRTHINPLGGCTRGREAVISELKEVHSTFLQGVTDTIEEIVVRFANAEVAIVTVPSTLLGTFITPDGVEHQNDPQIRTFVVVRRNHRWLIMQDQNTFRAR